MLSKFGILSVAAMAVDLKLSVSPSSRSTSSDGSRDALFDVVDVETLEVTIVASRQGLKLQIFPYSSSSTLSQRDMQDLVHVIVVAMLIPMLSSSKLLKI